MTAICIPGSFAKYFAGRTQVRVAADNLADVFSELNKMAPGFSDQILQKQAGFKSFVRVYVDQTLISGARPFTEVIVSNKSKVDIVVALVGG